LTTPTENNHGEQQKKVKPMPVNIVKNVLDETLERLIIPSFSKIGYKVRNRIYNWDNTHLNNLKGKTVAITGPTSGLGKEIATTLAKANANLILMARNPKKLASLKDELSKFDCKTTSIILDLSDSESVKQAATELKQTSVLDAVIHNAGAIYKERTVTQSGIELTFMTQVIAPNMINQIINNKLQKSSDSRIIYIASGGMYSQKLQVDDLQTKEKYSGSKAYAKAKRAQVELARVWSDNHDSIACYVTHPGWVDTPGLKHSLPKFYRILKPILRSTRQGVDTILWLTGTNKSELESGGFYHDREQRNRTLIPFTDSEPKDRIILSEKVQSVTEELLEQT